MVSAIFIILQNLSGIMANEIVQDVYQQRLAHSKVIYITGVDLLIDSGPSTEWDVLEDFIGDMGNVNKFFISHAHSDHTGNVQKIIDEYAPEVFIPENEPIEEIELNESSIQRVVDGEELVSGIEVVEVPGHTEGICALHIKEKEILLCSDILDGSDRRGLPKGFLLPPPAVYNYDTEKAEKNLGKLLDISFNTAVVTHGSNVTNEPQLKLEKYLDFINHYREKLLAENS